MASSAKRDLKTGKWMIQYRFTDWRGGVKSQQSVAFVQKRSRRVVAKVFDYTAK